MTPAEIQDVLNDTSGLRGLGEPQLLAMIVTLLNGGAMTEPQIQDLLNDSRCLNRCLNPKQLLAAIVELLSSAVPGGGAVQVYDGVAPPAAPDNPALAAIFYPDNDALPLQVWNKTLLVWRDI